MYEFLYTTTLLFNSKIFLIRSDLLIFLALSDNLSKDSFPLHVLLLLKDTLKFTIRNNYNQMLYANIRPAISETATDSEISSDLLQATASQEVLGNS